MDVAVLVKGRFETLEGARATAVSTNAWEIEIPLEAARNKRVRRGASAEDWDGAVFLVGGAESEPAVGSGESAKGVKVTVYFLGDAPSS